MEIGDYGYDEIKIGNVFEFKRAFSEDDINDYAKLTGDFNPLHCNHEYAKNTEFKGRIVHGMLVGSLFSTLVGMVCPGKRSLYLTQSLNFRKPVYPGSELVVRGTIKNKIDSAKIIVISTEVLVDNVVAVNGEAKVKVREEITSSKTRGG